MTSTIPKKRDLFNSALHKFCFVSIPDKMIIENYSGVRTGDEGMSEIWRFVRKNHVWPKAFSGVSIYILIPLLAHYS
jgi:hypothetical protein